jgi:DNA-binding GntR family transcriptional regulator
VSLEPSESASNAVASLHRGGSRLNHAVYDQLKERLLEGRYAAGERLSTEALRIEFGVSKHPVMEATRRLAGDGLIEMDADRGRAPGCAHTVQPVTSPA